MEAGKDVQGMNLTRMKWRNMWGIGRERYGKGSKVRRRNRKGREIN